MIGFVTKDRGGTAFKGDGRPERKPGGRALSLLLRGDLFTRQERWAANAQPKHVQVGISPCSKESKILIKQKGPRRCRVCVSARPLHKATLLQPHAHHCPRLVDVDGAQAG